MVEVHTEELLTTDAPNYGALDLSLGQAVSFPSLLQLRLRIEVPLWRDPGNWTPLCRPAEPLMLPVS